MQPRPRYQGSTIIELLERQEQLRRLHDALASARGGRGRIVAISGEAGIGKTSLVERFIADHCGRARVHRGACENLSTPEALLPLRDILRANGRQFDPRLDHIQSFEVLLQLLSRSDSPSVLVIEDLHWADTVTLDLVRFLARRIGQLAILVLLTYRDEEVDARSAVRSVLGEAGAGTLQRVSLEPLSLQAVKSLAASAGRHGESLFDLTAGNPFMVSEALAVEDELPTEAVRDATLARVARLPPSAQAVLEAVSVFPRRADTALVAELLKQDLSGLDACVGKGMLTLQGAVLRFRHELARRAVEASLAPSRKRGLHQAVIAELVHRPNARASEIVHHAEQAGDVETLLKYSRIAGDEAARAGAPSEAAAHYRALLQHRDSLDQATLTACLESYAEQSYLVGSVDTALSSMQEAVAMRRHAGQKLPLGRDLTRLTRFAWSCGLRELAEQSVSEAIAVLESLPASRDLAWAYSHKAQLEMLAFNTDEAITWGERALALAEQLGDRTIVAHALTNIGTAKSESPRWQSLVELQRSFELASEAQLQDHVERACCNLTCSYYTRRRYPDALSYADRGLGYASARDLTHWEAYLRGWRAMILLDQGHWQAAEDEISQVMNRSYASVLYRFPAMIALARLRMRRGDGDSDTPIGEAREVALKFSELQREVYAAALEAERAWVEGADTGQTAQAIQLLQEVHEQATRRQAPWVIEDAALWLYLLGQPPPGIDQLSSPFREHCQGQWQEAAEGWRALGRPYEEALALSEGDEAAQRAALEIFDRLSAAPAAARMRRQLRARGVRAIPRGPIAQTRANAAGLTRRQLQVLGLVDTGLSNVEIADRLCISSKTAEHHVSAVLARLEVTTRHEAGAAARALGLLGSP